MTRAGLLVLFVAACGSQRLPSTAPALANSGGAAARGPTAAHFTAPVLLKDLQSGDTACWLVVVDDHGQEENAPADYELCPGADHDATTLIGRKVALGWGHANVIAASCNGDPDCTRSDSIDVVTSVTPVRP